MARKFLYFVAFIIILALAGAITYRLNPGLVMRAALVPHEAFKAPPPAADNRSATASLWVARPDMPPAQNPALWMPHSGDALTSARLPRPVTPGPAAIFFIHPTSYLKNAHWNAPLDDGETNWRTGLFVRGMASVFADAGSVWAPRYRQAGIGTFLTHDAATANAALNVAYADVSAAFDQFLKDIPADQPIILAGHSQGALHLARLLHDKVAGRPVAHRIVAAYVIGWPLSVAHDLPSMGLPPCGPATSNCILSWQSFAEPADPSMILEVYDATLGFDGQPRRGSRMLCVNPLTGERDGSAPQSANLGTLKPTSDFADGMMIPGAVGARCDDAAQGGRGFLLIGAGPDMGGYLLPGNNYHVFDYPLYWQNIRRDVSRRLAAFQHRPAP